MHMQAKIDEGCSRVVTAKFEEPAWEAGQFGSKAALWIWTKGEGNRGVSVVA